MLNVHFIISIIAGILSFGLALWVLMKHRHAFVKQVFCVGMVILGVESIFNGLSLSAPAPMEAYQWQKGRIFLSSFHPAIWLVFSLIFGNSDYKNSLKKWKWGIWALFLLPGVLFLAFPTAFFTDVHTSAQKGFLLFRIGWAGYAHYIIVLLGLIAILINLERTLRSTAGRTRWQIKFVVLGLCGLWGERIYEISQTLLYWEVDLELQFMNIGTLIAANALVLIGMMRMASIQLSFYPSQSVLYNSMATLLVGSYFISIGVMAKIATYYGMDIGTIWKRFFIFLALLCLAIFVFSDRLRKKLKRFITLYLKRPTYDYQKEWIEFSRQTTSILDIRSLSQVIANRISKLMDVLSVSVWLVDSPPQKAEIGGSTSISEKQKPNLPKLSEIVMEMIRAIQEKRLPCEYNFLDGDWIDDSGKKRLLADEKIEYCLPLKAGERLLGAITLGERVAHHPFSVEDFELLKTIAGQTAASMLNLRLSEELVIAKEMEAFQKLSTFLLHDMKNLASGLSLTLGNAEAHFDNPEFRKDAFAVMERTLNKIKTMCSGLSLLSQGVEMKRDLLDLNHLVDATLKTYDGTMKGKIIKNLSLPRKISADGEQITKVLTNLIFNANEALEHGGEIRIETGQKNGWAILSVADSGCGMSKEFMEKSLFRPFRTTKKQGMGVGLFHSKMIIEAHGGRIEVESEEKVGSVFRVLLPLN